MTSHARQPWRPVDRDSSPSGAGFCSLPAKLPHEESWGIRQIWHTPRYWVALGFRPKSGEIRPFYALYRHLELGAGACAPDGMAMQHDASPPRARLEGRISAIYSPRRAGN